MGRVHPSPHISLDGLAVTTHWSCAQAPGCTDQRGDIFPETGGPVLLVLGLLAPDEQLAGSIEQLPLPLAHLDWMDGMVGGDLLDRLAATDRLHGDPGLELGTVGAALTHRWEPLSGTVPRLRG